MINLIHSRNFTYEIKHALRDFLISVAVESESPGGIRVGNFIDLIEK